MWNRTHARLVLAVALLGSACEGADAPAGTGASPGGRSQSVGEAPATTEPSAEAPTSAEFAGWTTFRHPLGTVFQHPPDWRVQETATGLVLVPPDLDSNRELIAGFGLPAQGVDDPLDARAVQSMDALMQRMLPMLSRSGRPRSIETPEGASAAYDYSGRAVDRTRVRCRVFVTIADDAVVGFSVLGDPESFERRVREVEKIFTTLRDGREDVAEGTDVRLAAGDFDERLDDRLDDRLVGAFRGESIASGPGAYVNTRLIYAFNADGTLLCGAQSFMNASERDHRGSLKWTADGSSAGNVETGRWSARDGFLTVRWERGSVSRFAYGFEPDGTLALRHAVTRELINIYSPVRR